MTEVSLPEEADCIISVCDSLNYLTEDGELSAAFACVKASLRQGGLFLFDMNTEYKFREVLAQNTYAVTEEHAAYIWENDYDPEEKINAYAVDVYKRQAQVLMIMPSKASFLTCSGVTAKLPKPCVENMRNT